MYTGIVQALLPAGHIDRRPGLMSFSLPVPAELQIDLVPGASVAVNGVCLTVTRIAGEDVYFDAIAETLALTNLGLLAEGALVNMERSARHDAEVGGHILSGHIIGTAIVNRIVRDENNCRMTFGVGHSSSQWLKYVFHKGFIAINGASLTVAELNRDEATVTVNLIPETLRRTNFALLDEGDEVNIEIESQTQAIVDTVERVMAERYPMSA